MDERVYKVSSALALKRSDKRPDRVEISPEQLSQATSHVEVNIRKFFFVNFCKPCYISTISLSTQANHKCYELRVFI